jgi:hypothetical protein
VAITALNFLINLEIKMLIDLMEDCFGCLMAKQCRMKYEAPNLCPCQKCLIKNICKEACEHYSLAYNCWSELHNSDSEK